MRLLLVAAAAAALALGGCNNPGGQSSDSTSAQQGGAAANVFPDLFAASYRAEATIRNPQSGELAPVVIYRAGRKQRIEFSTNGAETAVVSDADANQGFLVTQQGGRRMAMRMSLGDGPMRDAMTDWTQGRATTFVGACAAAGQVGAEWRMTPTAEDTVDRTACVTPDGILLKATEAGATTWETTAVSRGPQDPALFTPPADAVDMSALAGQMKAAMERAKSGQ